ncbi:MAG: NRDE family protein [Oceanicoccus sp.]
MCLILFAYQHHSDYPLIIAANRDEFFDRPTTAAHYWPESPEIFAGKDLQAGGTWMGVTRQGRFAAVTNYRNTHTPPNPAISRGALCKDFLRSNISPQEFLYQINKNRLDYAGFNLLLGGPDQLLYYANQTGDTIELNAGVHGLSNGVLNDSWPKVEHGKSALKTALEKTTEAEHLLDILLDDTPAHASKVPNTGIGIDTEIVLSSRFIPPTRDNSYGTRNCTVLKIDKENNSEWLEQAFSPSGKLGEQVTHHIEGITTPSNKISGY